eukprot:TRINITY_DN16202_c0_g1_i3.p1 TRINITY_DN16202_c0_g1~~TRINITY_DN16202_c0_g1_i3.p1  ORF type:complete len:152 (-),score=23.10 TRINITY_DN16202_c0_g1_i3:566-1021(-)
MVSSGADRPLDPPTNPKVTKLQELVNESSAVQGLARQGCSDSLQNEFVLQFSLREIHEKLQRQLNGWEKSWEQRLTPWDLGQPTPVILHLLQTGALLKGRALIPGCGSGYDVVAIASPERYVVGLDIADNAIKKAREISSSAPNADYFLHF